MSARATRRNAAETAEEIKTGGATAEVTATAASAGTEDEEKKRKQEEQDKAFFAKLPNPCVYCGPSVRGVARQFTVYHEGIPDALKEFIKEHRAAKGLLVSVERFAKVRTRLETPGTGEYILFRKVRAEL